MQTLDGFEKESEGIYSKGEHTYIIDANTGKVEEYTGTNPGGESGNEPQLNQYGFYEGVVYKMNAGDVYMYFENNISELRSKRGDNGTITIPGSRIQIKTNPSYEIADEAEPFVISGTVIEVDGEPSVKVGNDGELYSIAIAETNSEVSQITVLDQEEYWLVPNFNLDSDEIFTE